MDETRGTELEADDSDADPAEGCGCVAVAPRSDGEPPDHVPTPTQSATTPDDMSASSAEPPRRPLKLVATLQPSESGYHAILALGSDGCDPLFRALDAPDLPTVLAEAPALLTAAHQRWSVELRNATSRPTANVTSGSTTGASPIAPTSAPGASVGSPPPSDAPPAPAPGKPSSGQLSLFG